MNYRNYSIQSCLQVRMFITFYHFISFVLGTHTLQLWGPTGYLRTTTKIIISRMFQKSTLGSPDFRVSNISLLIWIKALKPFLKDSVLAVLFGWGQYAYPREAIKQRRRRRRGERQKSNSFRLAKQKLCTCITLFCTFLCRRCTTTTWNFPVSRLMKDVNAKTRIFFFFFWTSIQ